MMRRCLRSMKSSVLARYQCLWIPAAPFPVPHVRRLTCAFQAVVAFETSVTAVRAVALFASPASLMLVACSWSPSPGVTSVTKIAGAAVAGLQAPCWAGGTGLCYFSMQMIEAAPVNSQDPHPRRCAVIICTLLSPSLCCLQMPQKKNIRTG